MHVGFRIDGLGGVGWRWRDRGVLLVVAGPTRVRPPSALEDGALLLGPCPHGHKRNVQFRAEEVYRRGCQAGSRARRPSKILALKGGDSLSSVPSLELGLSANRFTRVFFFLTPSLRSGPTCTLAAQERERREWAARDYCAWCDGTPRIWSSMVVLTQYCDGSWYLL